MSKKYLAVGAIVRDEEIYICEWLEFHLLQGVEHFYITEHKPKSQILMKLITPYVKAGLVTYNITLEPHPQCKIYQQMLDSYGSQWQWMAYIDVDEFLYCGMSETSLLEVLESLPENCGAYAVHWRTYGSNGHKYHSPELVIKRFTKRAALSDNHVKSIVRPSLVKSVGNDPHTFYLKKGAVALKGIDYVNPLPLDYATSAPPAVEVLRINHYAIKSALEYRRRKQNPDVNSGVVYSPDKINEMFKERDLNEVADISAAVYSGRIRENMKKRGI